MKRAVIRWALAALLLTQAIAFAWVPEPGVWPDGVIPLALEFQSTAPNNSVAWDSAAREAIATWNALLQRVQLTTVAPTGQAWYDNGRNELFFDTKIYGEPFSSGLLAVTGVTTDHGEPVEGDIVFNSAPIVPWALYHGALQQNSVDFRRVAVHELGHLLGLDHPDEAGQHVSAIMNSVIGDIETPTADDQNGIHALYDRGSNAPPVILGLSSAKTVKQGTAAKLFVFAGGRGPFTYEWRRNNFPVANGNSATFQLAAAALSDEGDYTVVVSNGRGSVTSDPVHLTVNPAVAPAIEAVSVLPLTLTEGADYTIYLNGQLSHGDNPMQFEWKRNGVSVGVTTDPSFPLKDVQFSDAGEYTVTATNAAGSASGTVVRLQVTPGAPPQFLQGYSPVTVPASSSTTLSVNLAYVSGSPPFTYQWQKDGVDILNATGSSFIIPRATATDVGSYTVTVSNALGRATSEPIPVSITSGGLSKPPLITAQPTAFTRFVGRQAVFYLTVEGSGLNYVWMKDGVPVIIPPNQIGGFGQGTLLISNPQLSDAGVYSVEVSNFDGTVTSRGARLTVLPAYVPAITSQPAAQTVAPGGTVTLSVGVQTEYVVQVLEPMNYYTYQWFKDGVALAGQTSATCSFTATLADSGNYVVRVTTTSGAVVSSDPAKVIVTNGPLPLIVVQPTNQLYNTEDSEALRLNAVAQEVARRGIQRNGNFDTVEYRLIAAGGPTVGGVVPGTYALIVSRGGVTETSQPYTIGFLPPIVPVIKSHPQGRVADIGEQVVLGFGSTAFSPVTCQWTKDGVPIPGATDYSYNIPSFSASQAGSYRVIVTNSAGSTTSEPAVVEPRAASVPVISTQPISQTVTTERGATLSVTAAGGTLRYQWFKNGQPIANATQSSLSTGYSVSDTGSYAVTVSNGSATATSRTVQLKVLAATRAPEIIFPPASQTAPVNGDVTLVVGADGAPLPDRYQWRKNGVDIPGATDAELRLHNVNATDAASYTVVAYNANGSATSAAAIVTVDPSARLVNLATRANVGTGGNVLIAGFVITGTQPRSVLVRAIGDQLTDFGVTGVLRNPFLKLYDAKSTVIASSDDWRDGSDADPVRNARIAAIEAAEKETGAFPMRDDSQDGALVATLAPGNYTAQVSGMVNTTGVGLVEVYELGKPGPNRLINLSSRAVVGTGGGILIPGLTLNGAAPRRLLIRAVGPGLADFGVGGVLADPILTVFRGSDPIATNDNWEQQSGAVGAADIVRTTALAGGFALKAGSKDAALLIDLPPGGYTVQVAGAGGSTGVALVEVYEVTP